MATAFAVPPMCAGNQVLDEHLDEAYQQRRRYPAWRKPSPLVEENLAQVFSPQIEHLDRLFPGQCFTSFSRPCLGFRCKAQVLDLGS